MSKEIQNNGGWEEDLAKIGISPSASAAYVISRMAKSADQKGGVVGWRAFPLVWNALREQNDQMFDGDMKRVEAMLLDQSHVLQEIFSKYALKMGDAEYTSQLEVYAKIALKAQNQCRQTLGTLGELKNPKRATFIKQQNNAVNQQINGDNLQESKAEKNSNNSPNKLLSEVKGERLERGTSSEARRGDQAVEAVGEVNRTKDDRR
ncbi:MAG TPA: hypothetical protein EYN67_05445 [Flavobacteriales bacterium]|jgi:hypothetical protein|nr:hypothetical protein [Flavobacteriales bacterium]HHZ94998.1 hypothetical protein [Flavobacteriales bacterium]